MKKRILFFLLLLATADGVLAQSHYVETEGVVTTRRKGDFGEEVYLYSGYYYTKDSSIFGFGGEIGTSSETNYINPLVFIALESKKGNEFEFGLGPELDYSVRGTEKPALGISGYVSVNLKSQKKPDLNRFSLFGNIYYSEAYGEWHMASILYRPLKWFELGFHSQTDAVTGPRAGVIAGPLTLWFATDFKEKRNLIGLKFWTEWEGKLK